MLSLLLDVFFPPFCAVLFSLVLGFSEPDNVYLSFFSYINEMTCSSPELFEKKSTIYIFLNSLCAANTSPCNYIFFICSFQMSIRMSALEFYCNRPTLVALIEFGFDLSTVNSVPRNSPDMAPATQIVKPSDKEDGASTIVKGLLGYGKRRTIFNIKMDVDRVSMFLNKEDGSQLAMFVQEKFLFDLKVSLMY